MRVERENEEEKDGKEEGRKSQTQKKYGKGNQESQNTFVDAERSEEREEDDLKGREVEE